MKTLEINFHINKYLLTPYIYSSVVETICSTVATINNYA